MIFIWTYIVRWRRRSSIWNSRIIHRDCCHRIHCLLLLMMNNFIRIEKNIGRHEKSIIILTLQFKNISHVHWTQRCMCTFVWENERDRWRRTKSIISSFLSFSLCLSLSRFHSRAKRKRVWNSLSHIRSHTYTLLIALLPIYLLSTVHRPMKFQNCRVKRAEKTTATTTERKENRREREGEREREKKTKRPVRWTIRNIGSDWENEPCDVVLTGRMKISIND